MKLKFTFFVALLVAGYAAKAQTDAVAQQYASQITTTDLKDNLTILASDALEGRETGKRGQKMAAAFIQAIYQDLELAGPVNGAYFQPVELYTGIPGETYVKVGKETYKNYEQIFYYGTSSSEGEISLPAVFVGRGRTEDLEQVDIKGKAAVALLGAEESFRGKIDAIRAKEPKMVFFFHEDPATFTDLASQFKAYYADGILSVEKPTSNSAKPGVFFISPKVAEAIFSTSLDKIKKMVSEGAAKNTLKKLKEGNLAYKTTTDIKTLKTENVLGYLEGTDKKDELIIITSHYDHIGKLDGTEGDLINNGADDDGSGTVAVLQLAKVFAQAKKDGKGPRRSILFMNVTGEEKGLLGSDYYTQHPVFPLENTVVNLNIDMIGRTDPQHKDSADYVYVIGSDKLSMELHNLNERMNKTYTNLDLDYLYNDQNHPERLYYRSDHWNFAKNNIPIIFYFDGIHEDYHKPSDEVDKIEFDLLAKRAKLVFHTAWELANRDERIVPDANKGK